MDKLLIVFHTVDGVIKTGQLPQLGYWTYILLALLVAIEGPIATLLGAAAASAGLMNPFLVFGAAATGNLTADSLWYSLGYIGKTEWIQKFSSRLGLQENLVNFLKQKLLDHASQMLFLAKLTVSFIIPSLITAGLLRVPWRRWFPSLLAAETLWTGSLVLIGYFTTEITKHMVQSIGYGMLSISIMFVGLVILLGRRLVKNWQQAAMESMSPQS